MMGADPPAEIVGLAEERSRARAARDWAHADELRARIEAAGWRIEDAGTAFALLPARPPDLVEDGRTWHGSADTVPPRDPATGTASVSVVIICDERLGPPDPVLLGALAQPSAGTEVVVVAPRGLDVTGPFHELVGTAVPFRAGEAVVAALRRCVAPLVIVVAPDRHVEGDLPGAVAGALADPAIAIVGSEGLVSHDLRRYHPAPPGEVTAVRSGCFAFRRAEALVPGTLDSHLHLPDSLAAWASLALRDRGPDEPPRKAMALALPVSRARSAADLPDDHARLAKRDAYRIAARFARRSWLAHPEDGRLPHDGPDRDDEDDDPDEREDTGQA
jgi:hypothetical protein